ncbi:MAG TPA: pilus assembly protein N-terminal domain-containing protein [Polyangiales bacterium]|nr:pilus assembly protein N-terminal domain-containing protein [Polyangiales bacterium]
MNTMKWTVLIACLLVVTPAAAAPSSETRELSLAVGENRTVPADGVRNYSEGTPGVAEIRITPNGKQFVVVGKAPGSTTLLLIMNDNSELLWNINVFARAVQSVEDELRQLLEGTKGVRVRRVGARFFIEGGVNTPEDQGRIQHIASLYNGQVESLVVVGGAAAERNINVRVDVYFVQYEKSKLRQLGIDWPGRFASPLTTNFAYDFVSKLGSRSASIAVAPLPTLDLAAGRGWAKVLKHATVITANGSQATFTSGGAQNFSVSAALTASIQRIPFGTKILVLPRFEPKTNELEMQVNVDVADLTPSAADTNLPGESTSTLNTMVTLKLGESLVLSGVHTETWRNQTNGLPWLSEIPILGLLFGTQGQQSQEVEGAIFVIPGVVESVPQQADELIKQTLSEYARFDGDLEKVSPSERVPAASRPRPTVQP